MAKITEKEAKVACKIIAEGGNLRSAAKILNVSKSTLCRQLLDNYEKEYEKAREQRAIDHVEEMREYADELKSGDLDANVFKNLLDLTKWQAGKENSKMYGDKKEINANVRTLGDLLADVDDNPDDEVMSEIGDDDE